MTVREYNKFPCYGKGKYSGIIVKFSGLEYGNGIGEVVSAPNGSCYGLGYSSRTLHISEFIVINHTKKLKYNKW